MSDITPESIQSFIETLGSDSLKVVGGTYEGGIHLQQVPDEIAPCIFDLRHLASRNTYAFLEIGSAAGGNAFLFNWYFSLSRLVLIDNNKHPKHHLRPRILRDVPYIEFIGNSHSEEAFQFAANNQEGGYDIIFIDGDHSYEGVKQDAELYTKLASHQGFIIFHDTIAVPGIRDYVVEFQNTMDVKLIKTYKSETHPNPCGITLFQYFGLPKLKGATDEVQSM